MDNLENKVPEVNGEPVEQPAAEVAQEIPAPVAPEVPVAPAASSKNLSIAALVCGILGIVGSWIPVVSYFTLILAVLGIVFGAKATKQAKVTGENKGMATAGLVLGIIGTAFGALGIICAACVGGLAILGAAA